MPQNVNKCPKYFGTRALYIGLCVLVFCVEVAKNQSLATIGRRKKKPLPTMVKKIMFFVAMAFAEMLSIESEICFHPAPALQAPISHFSAISGIASRTLAKFNDRTSPWPRFYSHTKANNSNKASNGNRHCWYLAIVLLLSFSFGSVRVSVAFGLVLRIGLPLIQIRCLCFQIQDYTGQFK